MTTSLRLHLAILLVLLLQVSRVADGQGDGGCLTSINSLALREASVADTSAQRTYTLCINTEFEVGKLNYDNDIVLRDGTGQKNDMIPLRSNLRIMCGASGSRSNNCVVRGGDVLVDGTHFFGISRSARLDNVTVEGITFVGAEKHALWFTRQGSGVVFRDCEFRVSCCSRDRCEDAALM